MHVSRKPARPASPGAIDSLLSILDLEPLEENLFRGRSPQQSLAAGVRRPGAGPGAGGGRPHGAEPERIAHSLHAYFLLPRRPQRARSSTTSSACATARSFTTRRVTAIQHGRADVRHERLVPQTGAGPRASERDAQGAAARGPAERAGAEGPHARRAARPTCAATGSASGPSSCAPSMCRAISRARSAPPEQCVWMRASGRLPDDFPLHQCVLAYASDFSLLDTALIAHGKLMFDKDIQLASLDQPCGSTARSAPTSGCSTPRTAPRATAPAGFAAAASSPATACWSPRSRRKA